MATTTPDNIQYPVNSDQVAPLASHFKNVADSTQAALNTKVDTDDARLSDQRTPLDNSVTSAKIVNGTIVSADIADGTITGTDIASTTITETNIAALDYVKFDTTYSGGSTQPGMINWNDVDGTLEFQLKGGNVTLQIGQEQVVRVKNNTGSTIANGSAVYISGSDGNNLRVAKAQANSHTASVGTIGIATEDLVNGSGAYVTTFGLVHDLNTSALTEGAPVYLSSTVAGGLTSTRPASPAHNVTIGFCLRSHAVNGVLFVRVDTGSELDELHNVLITSPTNGQALTYDSATGLWKNATPVNSLSGLSDVQLSTLSANEVLKYNGTKWVNGTAAGGVTAAATAPDISAAKQGDAWFDTNDGTLYVCYIDADSTKQWVQVQANSALEGSILARLGSLEGQAIAYGAMSPNYLINGGMDIWQRGTSFTNPAAWTSWSADRWMNGYDGSGATRIVGQQTHTPGSEPYAGAKYFLRWNQTVAGTGGTYNIITHRVEDARTLANKTATISFWAKASANSACAVDLEQCFGTGGSANVYTQFGSFTATTSWQRFTFTITVPSISGKTIGSAGNDYIAPRFFFPVNTVMSFDLCGVQLEVGNTATSFRRAGVNMQGELAACQRYYKRFNASGSYTNLILGYQPNTSNSIYTVPLGITMRATPTVGWSSLSISDEVSYSANVSSVVISPEGTDKQNIYIYASTGGTFGVAFRPCSLRAAGNSAAYLEFIAEL